MYIYLYDTFDFKIRSLDPLGKSWAIRRLPEGQQWDGEIVRNIVGPPENWRLDAIEAHN